MTEPIRDILLSVEAECERIKGRPVGLESLRNAFREMCAASIFRREATLIHLAALAVMWVAERRSR